MIPIQTDGSGQPYIEIDGWLRVTVRHEQPERDTANCGRYLGFRLLKSSGSGVMPGPVMPIRSTLDDHNILREVETLLTRLNQPD